ncbi:MAG: D-alanyl-D-alanine carboxypeptidase [Geodermatophilaceae bacterium]|nr:D-alanyl-D-alanine carboxypeptidase [Geodermatophilaceae bacterium]
MASGRCARWLAAATLALLVGAPGALAEAAPTVDPSAPTPTTPHPGGPPEGRSPDGTVIGGAALGERGLIVPEGAPALPADITAQGWLVADLDTGEVLAARDPHGRYYPASTLKTLTLLALHGQLDSAAVVTGTTEDANAEGTKVGLVEGGQYPVALLFQALMMASGNDAAWALGRAAGGPQPTLELMNETASQLQAYDTVAGTPSGLDVAGQSSSAYDLALFMRAIVDDPELLAIMRTPTAVMPAFPPRYPAYQIQNQNPMLTSYPGMLAGKNGFTDAARYTYVGAAEQDGTRLVVSMMLGEQAPIPMVAQAALLLDWGFALPEGTAPVGELVQPRPPGVPAPAERSTEPTVHSSEDALAVTGGVGSAPTDSPAPVLLVGLGLSSALVVGLVLRGRRRRI